MVHPLFQRKNNHIGGRIHKFTHGDTALSGSASAGGFAQATRAANTTTPSVALPRRVTSHHAPVASMMGNISSQSAQKAPMTSHPRVLTGQEWHAAHAEADPFFQSGIA